VSNAERYFPGRGVIGPDWFARRNEGPIPADAPSDPDADELMWGDQQSVTFDLVGTGPAAQTIRQLILAERPAQEWTLNLAFSLPGTVVLPTLPNFSVTVTFTVLLGLGRSRVTRYEQLNSADLIGFAENPAFPTQIQTPIVSRTVPNLPASVVIVSAHILYDRILVAAPNPQIVQVAAGVAPIVRR